MKKVPDIYLHTIHDLFATTVQILYITASVLWVRVAVAVVGSEDFGVAPQRALVGLLLGGGRLSADVACVAVSLVGLSGKQTILEILRGFIFTLSDKYRWLKSFIAAVEQLNKLPSNPSTSN